MNPISALINLSGLRFRYINHYQVSSDVLNQLRANVIEEYRIESNRLLLQLSIQMTVANLHRNENRPTKNSSRQYIYIYIAKSTYD